jgi:ParB family transcriptional regulator, chromosome partitioning protein
MATDLWLEHRGAVTALLADDEQLLFTTDHPEGRATAVYRVDLTKGTATSDALPAGGRALVRGAASIFVAGTDGVVYAGPRAGGALSALASVDAAALALVADDRLAAVSGAELVILGHDGAERQRLALPEPGSALAADPTGRWLVVGTQRGTLVVFDGEAREDFVQSAAAQPHEGPVSLLAFEPDELRVLSCGADKRMLLTHVRGALEPEDRGGRGAHDGAVRGLVEGEDRFYTGGDDGVLKMWSREQRRPQTFKDAPRATALAALSHKGLPHLAVGAVDGGIRLYLLDGAGKITERRLTAQGALASARALLADTDPRRRQSALDRLHGYDDGASVDLLAGRCTEESDHALRVRACELLGASANARAVKHLEALLKQGSEAVRLAALAGLRHHLGAQDRRPLEWALAARKPEVGVAAVHALAALGDDDQALATVVSTRDHALPEVRQAALAALEGLHPKGPEASLIALESRHADLRWRALLRLQQRALLADPRALGAVRRRGDDADASVRQIAFQLAVLSQPELAGTLRHLDRDLHRQLHQLETHGQEAAAGAKLPKTKKGKPASLDAAALRPLLDALTSRALDTCVRGAVGLAWLQDPRAFGTLLQLSRESDDATRVDAAKALAALGDPRGRQRLRLMLRDPAQQVRDAAFSALARLLAKAPLTAAEAGLLAAHVDVRRRGLQLLVRELKKALDATGVELLARALNDAEAPLRAEAFKAALALQVGGPGPDTLRFVLRSMHAAVRREVLTEVMGEIAQPWAWPLLLELFADPDATLRGDAFDFAKKKGRGREGEYLEAALAAPHADLRLRATAALGARKHGGVALLIRATEDPAAEVRLSALAALETAEADEALIAALKSPHDDVRIRAATGRAAVGDRAAAKPLLAWIGQTLPVLAEAQATWRALAVIALEGLAHLQEAKAAEPAAALLADPDAALRAAAARTLAWCAPVEHLRDTLRHTDPAVQRAAALGLAWRGDPSGASILFPPAPAPAPAKRGRKAVRRKAAAASAPSGDPGEGLVAAMTLGDQDLFLSWLDHDDARIRTRALRLMMLHEWCENDGVPDRCLAALSSAHPRTRLAAARALEHFQDLQAFGAYTVELLAERGDDRPHALDPAVIAHLGEAIVHGEGRLRARAAELLSTLEGTDRLEAFDRGWRRLSRRFEKPLATLRDKAAKRKPAKPAYTAEALAQLVMGAYLGLSRQSGAATLRQSALARLSALHASGQAGLQVIAPALVQALSDGHHAVRAQAFEALRATDYPAGELAAEALATGHRNVAELGLTLLAGAAADGEAVLREVMLRHTDGLESAAAEELSERLGRAAAYAAALDAASPSLRGRAVAVLAELYPTEPAAAETLRGATTSRFRALRFNAGRRLAAHKDSAAWAPLLEQLADNDEDHQRKAARGLLTLGDARGPDALLDRVTTDPAGTADVSQLLKTVGDFRLESAADRLLALLAHKKRRKDAHDALATLAGYDQRWQLDEDPEDGEEDLDLEATAKQHPRRPALLARHLQTAFALDDAKLIKGVLRGARWSAAEPSLDAALAPLCAHSDDTIRHDAITAAGFRLRKRGGPPDGLTVALGGKDPVAQFLAAEALALAGHADGVSTLLSAVELAEDLDHRQRAVRALGTLGEARALDLLLRLVTEEGHALQDAAAEAIGHLASGDHRDRIFTVLERLAAPEDGLAEHALVGLRWFGGNAAWLIIRGALERDDWSVRERAAQLLRHHDDPDTRVALLERIRDDDDWDVFHAAERSARALFGEDALEVDYALMASEWRNEDDELLDRLRAQGDPGRLLALLPKVDDAEVRAELVTTLVSREPLPVEAAAEALSAPDPVVAAVAAHILGRAEQAGPALAAALDARLARRAELQALLDAGDDSHPDHAALDGLLARLAWACGRLEVGADALLRAAALDRPAARPIRVQAVTALARGFAGDAALDRLTTLAVGDDAELRRIAASAVARLAPDRVAALVPAALDDRVSLDRLIEGNTQATVDDALRAAAGRVHAQGVALPHLIARGDVTGLSAAAGDGGADTSTRLGAIEGLARVATTEACGAIESVAKDETADEDLRRAAWRALRRARRRTAAADAGEANR